MSKVTYFILFLLLAFLAFKFLIKKNGASQGEIAPEIKTQLIDGSDFKLSDLQGNYVFLDFWGSWCPPCRKENPQIAALYQKFKDAAFSDAEGFKVVTVAIEKNDKTWRSAAEKDGFVWKHQIVEESQFVAISSIARKYGVTDLPTKFLINPDGTLVGKVDIQFVNGLLTSKLK
ncbi:MAG: TlpA disulfide reductase family protein [Chitinophagales bacterium]